MKTKKSDAQILAECEFRFGITHTIKKIMSVDIDLRMLASDESVVAGDCKTYHFRLTKKEVPQTLIATPLPGLILIEKIQGEGAE